MTSQNSNLRLIRVPEWFFAPSSRFTDFSSAVSVLYGTVDEAEAYAASLSVFTHYNERLDIANISSELLSQLQKRSIALPTAVLAEDYAGIYTLWRQTTMIRSTQCAFCKHYCAEPGRVCTAFPNGIPDAIFEGEHDHRFAYPGDNDIRLEMRSGYSEALLGPPRWPHETPIAKAS